MYTFKERCEEVADLWMEDGTSKIFLNLTSKNGRPELVSLLQYMKFKIGVERGKELGSETADCPVKRNVFLFFRDKGFYMMIGRR